MKKLLLLGLLAVSSGAFAAPFYYEGDLTANDPRYTNPGGQTGGNQAYDVFQFQVTVTGSYTIEMASRNTTNIPSNALDTFLAIYPNAFNPGAPGAPQAFNDDFTGTLTVLPGPYNPPLTSTATGFTGAQPSSRIAAVTLTAGVNYFLINTSFRPVDYSAPGTSQGLGVGHYYTGLNGPGNIVPVPEPATLAALGLGAAALLRRRKKA